VPRAQKRIRASSKGKFMSRKYGFGRARVVAVAVAGVCAVGLAGVAGQSFAEETPAGGPPQFVFPSDGGGVPPGSSAIDPPAGSRQIASFQVAQGTQNYTCAGGVFGGAATPEATLVGPAGTVHHFAGPTWQLLDDGSTVRAAKQAEQPVPGAVPELLLQVTSRDGTGLLTEATHIQRLFTQGGAAPAGQCTDGDMISVPYSALYIFWAAP
jgi:hypothetical protein